MQRKQHTLQKLLLLLISVSLWSTSSNASNRYYADNTLEPTSGFAWDWSAGAGYYVEDSYLVGMDSYSDGLELDINLAVSYERFYLEIDHSQLSGGIIIGYSIINKYNWDLDILGTNMQAGFDETGLDFYSSGVVPELQNPLLRSSHAAGMPRLHAAKLPRLGAGRKFRWLHSSERQLVVFAHHHCHYQHQD